MPKILVIDDSPTVLEIVEVVLAEAGYQVHACTDVRHGLQALQREPFDLIVTDIYMPDTDGIELIREGRRIRPNIPIVAMSGVTGRRGMLAVAKHLGACQTVLKPFSKADLLDAAGAALGKSPAGNPLSPWGVPPGGFANARRAASRTASPPRPDPNSPCRKNGADQ
jgi:CheY-like chemotaxis protein